MKGPWFKSKWERNFKLWLGCVLDPARRALEHNVLNVVGCKKACDKAVTSLLIFLCVVYFDQRLGAAHSKR